MVDTGIELTRDQQVERFRKSLPMRVLLDEIVRLLGRVDGQDCLDVGLDDGVLSHHLRSMSGTWATVMTSREAVEEAGTFIDDGLHVFDAGVLPFPDKSFNAVVVGRLFERVSNDMSLIEECHRVLKPDGRLIVVVPRAHNWSVVGLFRRLFGVTPEKLGWVRAGYTESELFRILKSGFDVHKMHSYSRFFVELVDTFVQAAMRGIHPDRRPGTDGRAMRAYSVAAPFYWLAFQLDMLLFFNRGHTIIARAQRRAWRARDAPVLVDGRSISEAVLSKPSH